MNVADVAAAFAGASKPPELTLEDIRNAKGIHPMQRRVPPSADGVPYDKWLAQRPLCDPKELEAYRSWVAALEAKWESEDRARHEKGKSKSIATKRDSYGWKSLPEGSSLLGAPGRRHA